VGKKSDALAVRLDDKGKVKYDAIARQGHGKDKVVYSSISQLLPAEVLAEDADELQRPDEETVLETTEETRLALEKLTNQKITSALPVRHAQKAGPAQYWDREDERRLAARGAPKIGALVSAKIAAPPYGQRKDWIPRTDADFGDGGAFPEIHVAQYPLGGFSLP